MAKPGRHHIFFALFILFSCAASSAAESLPVMDDAIQKEAKEAWRARRLAYGEEIYNQACGSCHDEGLSGAPAIGDQQAWSERSPFWSAVLFEHSKDGYLAMPAKGNHPELTDQAIDAAGEYLLSVTFPELPLD